MNFATDNIVGASDTILQALVASNHGTAATYGADEFTERAAHLVCEIFERDCAVFLVATGTAANALALGAIVPPYGAIVCTADAHIMDSECGAPEMFTAGAKLLGVGGEGGKMTAADLAAHLSLFPRGVIHQVQPAALSLSQATESGTAYSVDEVRALAQTAHDAGLSVHMDGARFANALVGLGCTPAEITWKAGIDVLSFGATKNGALACEAVVFFDPAKATQFGYQRKRGGHTLSKGRVLGVQMTAYLEGGLWLELARKANARARALSDGLAAISGVRIVWPTQANEVFVALPAPADAALKDAGAHYYDWGRRNTDWRRRNYDAAVEVLPRNDDVFVRLVCSFATTQGDVDEFIAIARRAMAGERAEAAPGPARSHARLNRRGRQ